MIIEKKGYKANCVWVCVQCEAWKSVSEQAIFIYGGIYQAHTFITNLSLLKQQRSIVRSW